MPTRRLLALAAASLSSLLFVLGTQPAHAAPPPCEGVWVVVQPSEADPTSIEAKCATEFSTGAEAVANAGFAVEQAGSVVSRIDGLPEDADFNSNGGFYWSYWSATVDPDGALGKWEYYQVGANASKPTIGKAEGWLLTNKQDVAGPALTNIGEAASAESPAATAAPQPVNPGTPLGAILAGVAVAVAAIGLLAWWLLKGRRR